eukprot:TRINITY_DN18054_c0_g2_i1.p1 TRINITY_DN18054_c0_g2~~TRINITY_DN18054_c0_g2_i1.p1  ORF type:complete len:659 (+),score=153.38 TRINITY_DN18054_c0_g2_i1:138-2114(+)
MGKSKKKAAGADEPSFVVDAKVVNAMGPDERASWLSLGCRLANEGAVNLNKLYDVLRDDRIANDLPDKIGLRMARTITKHLSLFSEKQQRALKDSRLLTDFLAKPAGTRDTESRNVPPVRVEQPTSADMMEEMMARCRNFVRENAAGYEERQQAVFQQEEAARLAREWEEIANWHQPLEEFEKARMTREDDVLQQRAREAEEAKQRAIEKWKRESELKLEEEERKREEERRLLEIVQERRKEELRLARERFIAEEEARRRREEEIEQARKDEAERRSNERVLAEQRRVAEEKRRVDMLRAEQIRKQMEKEHQIDEERRRVEEERRRAEEERRRIERIEEEKRRQIMEAENRRQQRAMDERNTAVGAMRALEEARMRSEQRTKSEETADIHPIFKSMQQLQSTPKSSDLGASLLKAFDTGLGFASLEATKSVSHNMSPPPTGDGHSSVEASRPAPDAERVVPSSDVSQSAAAAHQESKITTAHQENATIREESREDADETQPIEPPKKKQKAAAQKKTKREATTPTQATTFGWMTPGAECTLCSKKVTARGGIVCGRKRPCGQIVGCGANVCWKCMVKARKEDFGDVRTTKEEFVSLGDEAWWLHEGCMAPEDEAAYFDAGDADAEEAVAAADVAGSTKPTNKKSKKKVEDDEEKFAWE